ncbi:pheromone-processing carboxypeptidase KEX1-like [Senna tora]|uniref:Pheromone-processing carboxypeptidase KEX1-like n=1 Tax=Senna tora TaxID=362788 RepID=A0A834WV51_9FABA|nr:pheromone-processing carboxypeptidase KEX1-like [Senna tora]
MLEIGCKVHPRYGIIEINCKKHFSKYEPFVLAQQSQQVYFAEYASKKRDRADWLVVCKIKSRTTVNAPELAYQEDEVSIQNEIDDDDEDPQEEVGDEEEVGEEVEIEIEDDGVNDQEDIVEMDIEGGFEIDDSSTEDENEDSEDQIDYGMTRGKGKARSTGVDRGGYHKVGRNKSIESVQCPTMEQVPIVQPPIEQVPIVQLSIEQVPIVELPIEQSPVVHRPPSDVAEEDHLESEGPSLTNTQQEIAYLKVRSQPRKSLVGRTYLEPLRDSYYPHSAIRELTKIIKKYFHGPWATWEGPSFIADSQHSTIRFQSQSSVIATITSSNISPIYQSTRIFTAQDKNLWKILNRVEQEISLTYLQTKHFLFRGGGGFFSFTLPKHFSIFSGKICYNETTAPRDLSGGHVSSFGGESFCRR